MEEVLLQGGNVSQVTTDGSIIYKDCKAQSATVHRLLRHLENKKIDFCPRFLGIDEEGREKLSYMKGFTMDNYPESRDLEVRRATIRKAAELLKEYHDATVDFELLPSDQWFLEYDGNLSKEVVCHNDFAPYNVTFEQHMPVGIIDFDTACPAPRVWDIAYAAYRFVPLGAEVYDSERRAYRTYEKTKDAPERKLLLREFLRAYGTVINLKDPILLRLKALVELFDKECEKGNQAFIRMKEEGHQEFYRKEIEFIKRNFSDWWD